jgi:hypothetical protein
VTIHLKAHTFSASNSVARRNSIVRRRRNDIDRFGRGTANLTSSNGIDERVGCATAATDQHLDSKRLFGWSATESAQHYRFAVEHVIQLIVSSRVSSVHSYQGRGVERVSTILTVLFAAQIFEEKVSTGRSVGISTEKGDRQQTRSSRAGATQKAGNVLTQRFEHHSSGV